MATEDSTTAGQREDRSDTPATRTFEDIEWDEMGTGSRATVSKGLVLKILSSLALTAALVYDYFVLQNEEPTIGIINWDILPTEWLFAYVLLLGLFYVMIPLAKNRRMTGYYWRHFRKNRLAVFSLLFLLFVFVIGIIGPVIWQNPNDMLDFGDAYAPPIFLGGSWEHALGTDAQGRHLWHLIVWGMRVSLEVGLIAMTIAITIGTTVGTVAAHFGGYIDEVLMRYVDIQQTFPVFILLLFLLYLWGQSLFIIVVLYGFFGWETIGRLVRSEALQRTEEAYVTAAEAAGASRWWIVRRHIIPNVSGTVITAATLAVPVFILGEATLAFLGFSDPDVFSWGRTIAAGRGDLSNAFWIATMPGLFLFLTVLAINFVGDGLNDAIDPRR